MAPTFTMPLWKLGYVPAVAKYDRRKLVEFWAVGLPKPKGNLRASVRFGTHAVLYEATKDLKPWLRAVRGAAIGAMGDGAPTRGSCCVEMAFEFERPKSHYTTTGKLSALGRRTPRPRGRSGDIDKLERAVLDALQPSKPTDLLKQQPAIVFENDQQVDEVHKTCAWGDIAGVRVVVSEIIDA